MEIQTRWAPGTLRDLFLMKQKDVCACRREMAENGLKHPRQRFEDVAILGEGAFGVVRRGRCKKTHKQYAIKLTLPVSYDGWKERRSEGRKEGRVFQCLVVFYIATLQKQQIVRIANKSNATEILKNIYGSRLKCGSPLTSL